MEKWKFCKLLERTQGESIKVLEKSGSKYREKTYKADNEVPYYSEMGEEVYTR